MVPSQFQQALKRGMEMDADLSDSLDGFDDYPVTLEDALAICEALKQLPRPSDYRLGVIFSTLSTLLGFFQSVAKEKLPACNVLYEHGIPELIRIFNEMVAQPEVYGEADDPMMLLKMLAWYQHEGGTKALVKAALIPYKPNEYLWHVTLDAVSKNHPHRDFIYESLRNQLPPGFLGISLLDSANKAANEDGLQKHPFDSPDGHGRLEEYLTNRDESEFSYAVSATAALPYMSEPARTQLMALAMDHVDVSIQLQAADSAARLGSSAGLQVLARFAEDVNYSMEAIAKLIELDKLEFIPTAALQDDFRAKSEFTQWLRHPNELGKPPTDIEIVDHRELFWPPNGERKSLYLLRYRLVEEGGCELDDCDTDCGMVGSHTFCLFGAKNHQRPPEDVYAIHCCWEMEVAKRITEEDIPDHAHDNKIIPKINGKSVDDPTFLFVYKFADDLNYPNHQVVVLSGSLDGEEGWLVVDGPRSSWYPKSEQPEETRDPVIAKLHIGRVLLGFDQPADRLRYLHAKQIFLPEKIIQVYEKLLQEAEVGSADRQRELLGSFGSIDKHFEKYLQAKAEVSHRSEEGLFVEAYEQVFDLCENAKASVIPSLFYSFSIIHSRLDEYVNAKQRASAENKDAIIVSLFDRFLGILKNTPDPKETRLLNSLGLIADKLDWFIDAFLATGKGDRIPEIVRYLAQFWTKPDRRLGRAAYVGGECDLAESYLLPFAEMPKSKIRLSELSLLADIWYRKGKIAEAEDLLLTCLDNVVRMTESCKYKTDLKRYQEDYQHHSGMYAKLFPEKAKNIPNLVLPESPLS